MEMILEAINLLLLMAMLALLLQPFDKREEIKTAVRLEIAKRLSSGKKRSTVLMPSTMSEVAARQEEKEDAEDGI